MSNGTSWFLLTLWRGTPPEFTEQINTEIHESDSADASVRTRDTADSKIETSNSLISKISICLSLDAEIINRTEVVWHVG